LLRTRSSNFWAFYAINRVGQRVELSGQNSGQDVVSDSVSGSVTGSSDG